MSVYHCCIKIGSRTNGQSAIAAAAYRSGTTLEDKEIGQTSDYTRKSGVVYSEIDLCKNAPAEYTDREKLWNSVHEIEKSKNAQLWREVEIALPIELSRIEQIRAVKEYVRTFVKQGMCADWSLHDKQDGNPHAHIMLTMRSISADGKWSAKCRKIYDLDENGEKIYQHSDLQGRKQYKSHKEDFNDWNSKDKAELWRKKWADVCNKYLREEKRIDHRSFERQGKTEIPTIHEGFTARKIEKSGQVSERCQLNREIKAHRQHLWTVKKALRDNQIAKSELELREQAVMRANQSNDSELEEVTEYKRTQKLSDAPQSLTEPQNNTMTNYFNKRTQKLSDAPQSLTEPQNNTMTNYFNKRTQKLSDAPQSLTERTLMTYDALVAENRKFSKRLETLARVKNAISTYKRNKSIQDNYDKIPKLFRKKKEKYNNENWQELRSFQESKKILKQMYPNGTVPSEKEIEKEIEKLTANIDNNAEIMRKHDKQESEKKQRAYFTMQQLKKSAKRIPEEYEPPELDLTQSRGRGR